MTPSTTAPTAKPVRGAAIPAATPVAGDPGDGNLARGASALARGALTVMGTLPVIGEPIRQARNQLQPGSAASQMAAAGNPREMGQALRSSIGQGVDDLGNAVAPITDFAGGLMGLPDPSAPVAGASGTAAQGATVATPSPASQLAAGAMPTSVPGIVRFEGPDGVPIYTNRPSETAAELAGNGGQLRYGVTGVPTVVPPPGVAMSEATGVTPGVGDRTRPAPGFTAQDRMNQLALMAQRSNNYQADRAAERNSRLIGDARAAALAGRGSEASQLAQLAQVAGNQSPQRTAPTIDPASLDPTARAQAAATLQGTQLANEGTALANRGTAAQNRATQIALEQAEQDAALMADLLSGDAAKQQAAAEKLARRNALTAKPEKPITAQVAGEGGSDEYIIDPRTGQTVFDPTKARAVAQTRNAISAALADGDEQLALELAEQLRRSHGVDLGFGKAGD